jgi:Type I restriction enzyme R protein N terminus (HSDR_N)
MLIDIDFIQFKNLLRFQSRSNKTEVYDLIRRKFVVLQPEEFVRQLVVQYLIREKNYPLSKIRIEMGLTVNELQKRCDILVFDKNIKPFLLIECKSSNIKLDQSVFEQVARYNLKLRVPFLMITNGLSTYCCEMDYLTEGWTFLNEIPILE